jgi:F-type H+-transporting ATPase subunit gamma
MASSQQLKSRISSVKNTKQITKAMELVSASKMRRAQEHAKRSRDYRNMARQILARLRETTDVGKNPLYAFRITNKRLHVVVTSNRGLAGAYNSNILRRLTKELIDDKEAGIKSQAIVIGKQGAKFIVRFEDVEVVAVYTDFPENPSANDIRPILDTVIQKFKDGEADAVDVLYTDYKSSIVQEVAVERLLPAAYSDDDVASDLIDTLGDVIFEPSPKAVLDAVTERLIEAQLNQAFLESSASEQSMRMMAMKSATDNASDLIEDLTLAFNTARQAAITQELAEITGGSEAIK